MSANATKSSLARLMEKMDLEFNQHKDSTLPLSQVITREVYQKLSTLTRLYRLPKSRLRDGVKRGAYYNRLKARRLLRIVLRKYGLAVIFLYSQATSETQLGRLNTQAVLEALDPWHQRVAQSQRLRDIAEYLSNQSRATDADGTTDLLYAAPSPEPSEFHLEVAPSYISKHESDGTRQGEEAEHPQQKSALSTEHPPMASSSVTQMPKRTILEIDATYFADFLRRESTGVLSVVCERGTDPALPYIDFGGKQEHRVTLSYGLGSALVQYMNELRAELRNDGTFALTDAQKQSSGDPTSRLPESAP